MANKYRGGNVGHSFQRLRFGRIEADRRVSNVAGARVWYASEPRSLATARESVLILLLFSKDLRRKRERERGREREKKSGDRRVHATPEKILLLLLYYIILYYYYYI